MNTPVSPCSHTPRSRLSRLVTALALATLNFLLLANCMIPIIGPETWNQVVSRELLWTYF